MLEKRSDRDLKQRVLREMKWDSRIDWASINVEVNDAVATLTGTVPSYAQKIAAQDAAHRVVGVLDVDSEKYAHFDNVDKRFLEELVKSIAV